MGVAKHLHNLNFPKNLLQVFFVQLGFIYDLDGNLGLGDEVRGPLDHGEVALADGAVDLVVADASGHRPAGGRG